MNALRKVAEATADPTPAWKRTPSGRTPGSARSAGRPPSASPAPGGRNFIEENLVTAGVPARPPARPKPSTPLDAAGAANDGQRYLQKKDYGKLPEYLMDRKIELARQYEAELAAKEAALIPPGACMHDTLSL